MRTVDVIIVGASLSAAAAAKRLVDAGLETIILERKELPRHKICSGILSPRGHRFISRISDRCRARRCTSRPHAAA